MYNKANSGQLGSYNSMKTKAQQLNLSVPGSLQKIKKIGGYTLVNTALSQLLRRVSGIKLQMS